MKRGHSLILILFAVTTFLVSCKKSDTPISISGIEARDENGVIIPSKGTDLSDWSYNGSVPDNILALLKMSPAQFNPYTGGSYDPNNPLGEVSTLAYPNPTSGNFVLRAVLLDSSYAFNFVVVDKTMTVQKSGSLSGNANESTVSISSLTNGLYRVYYVYLNPQGRVLYKGFGDIQKQ